ncbi:cell wall metabolism sensor histidine kinase WalK [Frankia sp. QA3]|uniref:sensor histidine kinase n=1 Tax=Frankia sp. QA3 TaxID=710111 RepID=UPI0012FAE8C3|nr:HAMP domain-containing sensor histidine kinase [Frankia sp. QA3]
MRLTAAVTVLVGAALVLASVLLVHSMSRTLLGRAETAARAEVDRAADALAHGRPLDDRRTVPAEYITVIQVLDPAGRLVAQLPPPVADPVAPAERARAGATRPGAVPGPGATGPGGPGGEAGLPSREHPAKNLVVASRTVRTPDGPRTVRAVSRLGQVTASVHVVQRALLVATPLLTVLVGALTWFAVDRALRPIESVRRRAEAISHSTLGERLPHARTGDEVERLTATLNAMLDRLDAGARRQRQFVSDASHELRTPLAAMRAELEISLAHRGDAEWRPAATRLLDDHRRLDRLTGDLLLLARVDDAPAPTARGAPVDLAVVVAGELPAVTRARPTVDLAPVFTTGVEADLVRLVRNLLDNADRHAATTVAVRLRHVGGGSGPPPRIGPPQGWAVLTVDDDGPGIPAADRERVFDRFVRLDDGRNRDSGGSGLGLAIVRGVAHRHGGTVTATASPLGGARFEVRLPLA